MISSLFEALRSDRWLLLDGFRVQAAMSRVTLELARRLRLADAFACNRFFEQRFRPAEGATTWILFSYDGLLDLRVSTVILSREELPL